MLIHLTTRLIIINIKRFLINSCHDLHLGLGTPFISQPTFPTPRGRRTRTWNSQTHPAAVRPGRGVVYGARVTWLRWKHLRGDASSRPRPANSCVKGLSLLVLQLHTLISYTRYYGVAYKLAVKKIKSEKNKY